VKAKNVWNLSQHALPPLFGVAPCFTGEWWYGFCFVPLWAGIGIRREWVQNGRTFRGWSWHRTREAIAWPIGGLVGAGLGVPVALWWVPA
jgi:hypothetical protein